MNILMYGTGNCSKQWSDIFEDSLVDILAYVDSDEQKKGLTFYGKKVITCAQIENYKFDYIMIASSFLEEIRKKILEETKVVEEQIVAFNDLRKIYKEFMLDYYKKKPEIVEADKELQEAIQYLKNADINKVTPFCYCFADTYVENAENIFYDHEKKLYYTLLAEKKMYLKKSMDRKKAAVYCKSIIMEQDERSPHRYLTEEFDVKAGSVIVDAGVAEGNFTLSVIDRIKKAYLFESDDEWIEALKATFEPYGNKVQIIKKILSNVDDKNCVTLDRYLSDEKIDFLKIDVEGMEKEVIEGSKNILNQENVQVAVCTYHKNNDDILIKQILEKKGYFTEYSKGYMFFFYDKEFIKHPYFRRAVIRGRK